MIRGKSPTGKDLRGFAAVLSLCPWPRSIPSIATARTPILTGCSRSAAHDRTLAGGSRSGADDRPRPAARALVLGALGAAATALLLPSLALMRYTDAHDWYAARKVSVAQALIFVGFDERASTKYRLSDGRTVTWLREGVATYPAALRSRSHILAVIGDNILLGASTGFVVVFTLSGLLNLARHESAGCRGRPAPAFGSGAPARLPCGRFAVCGARTEPGRCRFARCAHTGGGTARAAREAGARRGV